MATAREWQRRVQAWRGSGDSAAEFAARVGCNARTLTWWASRLGVKARRPVRFVRLLAGGESAPTATVDVVLAGGRLVRVGPGFDAALLRAVVQTLEAE